MNADLVSPALFDSIASALFVVEDKMIRYTNVAAQRLLGYSSEVLTQCRFSDLIHPEFLRAIFPSYPQTDLGALQNVEIRLLPSDSRLLWCNFSAARLESNRSQDRDVWMITICDVTQ